MKQALRPAFTATIPVLCGYLFIGFAFGVMLRDAGFAPPWALLCSLTIYAGSGQYLLVSLLAGGASLVTVAVMTLLLNCRHIFYGLSFLEPFHQMGGKKWYMIFALTDETYSLLCSLQTPAGVDPSAMRFLIAVLDHSYWILGSVAGGVIGGVLPFDSTGIDFAMTALFTVIFVEQWLQSKCHIPALMGLGAAAVSLALLGADNFILPAMLAICVMLVAARGRLYREEAT
ncbi:MAG: AzlC family ABC transporter permease [Agathobaculum sp.]|uniref:AzlC family ABC transporter permease n=1 Tax=Agathobaculum sp. TaxID=2048138 RepID=UPI0025C4510F|nr:AzlC family ABC transporter permease [Agathobaculum sp.]MCI7125822.1 AzlC family ABC transporter permease [Agathobaculum sp.]MDY3711428.1 AzlC family ABC transporter permease [Agathobaculum sp.]